MTPSGQSPYAGRVLVIGIGNAYRGDDAAGLAVAEWLRATAPPEIEVMRHEGEPVSLLETWDQVPVVYLVDAMASGAEPGSVYRFDAAAWAAAAPVKPPRDPTRSAWPTPSSWPGARPAPAPARRLWHRGQLLRDRGHPVAAGT